MTREPIEHDTTCIRGEEIYPPIRYRARVTRLVLIPLAIWSLWALATILIGGRGPDALRITLAIAAVVLVVITAYPFGLRGLIGAQCTLAGLATLAFYGLRPSHTRDWTEDQSRLPHLELIGDRLTVENLRIFRYNGPLAWTAAWTTRTYDLTELEGVDFVVERFTTNEAIAHTLVSFRFANAEPLAISVEIRKEKGESFSPLKGLFRQYELMYVFGDERDLIELRAVHREDTVYLHPMNTSPSFVRTFLEHLVAGAQAVEAEPAFYNTATASCSTVLADHLRAISDTPWDWRMHLPGYSDALAFERGMIATDLGFEATRERNRIDTRAKSAAGSDDFSAKIRQRRR